MRALQAALVGAMVLGSSPIMAVTPISPPHKVPVLLRSDAISDACPSTVRPRLPPGGRDGFVSLRAGPGTAWPEIARLRADVLMFACETNGKWTAVIVQPPGGGDCGLPTPAPAQATQYPGPCRHGWVADRCLETVAG